MEGEDITLREVQRQVDEWIKTVGVRYFSPLTNMACLTEEVGEVARVMARKYGDQSFKKGEEEKEDLSDELADVLWVVCCLANQTGTDLTTAFWKTIEKKTKRDKDRHKDNIKLRDIMNGKKIIEAYGYPAALDNLEARIAGYTQEANKMAGDVETLKRLLNAIDLTTLSHTDTEASVSKFIGHVNTFAKDYPTLKNVGGICLYSRFASQLSKTLTAEGVQKAVVAACFPSSQASVALKKADIEEAAKGGVTEVDIVISVGEMIEGNYDFVFDELKTLCNVVPGLRTKVILETGALPTHKLMWEASVLACEAGADMIKTSTGKNCNGASAEAAIVMCEAIKAYKAKTGRLVGFKAAGGISTVEDAAKYYAIAKDLVGKEVESNLYFRIGASRLANTLLKAIVEKEGGKLDGNYF
ncbi:MAG: deoxyribose-phosphate aldolase [Bacteroidales bacterium]|nr:deoxyribose-phosphate aldolase [Bacteroidales bacterium]